MSSNTGYDRSKDPKVDISKMSKEDALNYYTDKARAQQLIRTGNQMLDSGDTYTGAANLHEALVLLKKYEKYTKNN
jgi:hypothetical protein